MGKVYSKTHSAIRLEGFHAGLIRLRALAGNLLGRAGQMKSNLLQAGFLFVR